MNRRLGALLAASFLFCMAMLPRHALAAPPPPSPAPRTQEVAWNECQAWASYSAGVYSIPYYCKKHPSSTATSGSYWCERGNDTNVGTGSPCLQYSTHAWQIACPTGTVWNEGEKKCKPPCPAVDTPISGATWMQAPNKDQFSACKDGCKYLDSDDNVVYSVVDGQTWVEVTGWVSVAQQCTAGTPNNVFDGKPNDADNDGVSDGNDLFPNNPNENADDDGDGEGNNNDLDDDDADNGQDGGTGDETDNVATGGGLCDEAPQCSGDAIQCNQLYQQWKMRCEIEKGGAKVSGSPESCEAAYTCTGDTAQCAQVALLRKTACKDAVTGDNAAANEILDGLKGGPGDQPNSNPMGIWIPDTTDADADDAGYGLSRSCPPPPSVFGKTIDVGPMCNLGAIVAAIILMAGFVQFGYAFLR